MLDVFLGVLKFFAAFLAFAVAFGVMWFASIKAIRFLAGNSWQKVRKPGWRHFRVQLGIRDYLVDAREDRYGEVVWKVQRVDPKDGEDAEVPAGSDLHRRLVQLIVQFMGPTWKLGQARPPERQ